MLTIRFPGPFGLLCPFVPLMLCWPLAPVQAVAQTFTVLYTFDSVNYANGYAPTGALAMDGNGVLYGVTSVGGAYSQCDDGAEYGCGTVYSLSPPAASGSAWTETVLWSFGASASDGSIPIGVVMGRDGVLYGTTSNGGQSSCGTVFSLTPPSTPGGAWTEAIIWTFPACGGVLYQSGLAADSKGTLYGTDFYGGPRRRGDVYSLNPPASPGGAWRHTELWVSRDEASGENPQAGVVIGPDGVLYATAFYGGSGRSGVVFSLTPPTAPGAGWTQTVLYNFPEGTGWHPTALALGTDGVLYGTTYLLEPTSKQGGTIFSLTPPAAQGDPWTETTLWQFPTIRRIGGTSDAPYGPLLIQPQTGALFGATGNGYSFGVLFEVVPPSSIGSGWNEQTLPPNSLNQPMLGLGRPGALYGTDGVANWVWSLTP
jgi:uncharacterized repeat protein (TIGR03803 family)